MDSLNKKILIELQRNGRVAASEIGRRIGLSAPAVGDRIQKMETEGIILGYTSNINFEKIGLSIQAFITFRSVSISHSEFLKFVKKLKEVQECYIVTGSPGAFLKVAVDSTRNLGLLIDKLKAYGETNTSIILSQPVGFGTLEF